MADIKISDLPSASSATGGMQLEVNDGGVSKRVTAEQIKDYSVADGSITSAKLATDSVVEAKIQNGAVTTNKLADGAVTALKVNNTLDLSSKSVTLGTVPFGAGTDSAPAITRAGDTNTGVYFPAADTVGVVTNGVERARIDSSGNVGIGTSSPVGIAAGHTVLDVAGASSATANIYIHGNGRSGNSSGLQIQDSTASCGFYSYNNIPMEFCTNGNNRLAIASNGQLSAVIPGGTTLYPSFTARAWVNFDGTGTVAIRASGNVSSITDYGNGSYGVNFSTAMPDRNYSVSGSASWETDDTWGLALGVHGGPTYRTTTGVDVVAFHTATGTAANWVTLDSKDVDVTIFR
jgi:hypothetical protein